MKNVFSSLFQRTKEFQLNWKALLSKIHLIKSEVLIVFDRSSAPILQCSSSPPLIFSRHWWKNYKSHKIKNHYYKNYKIINQPIHIRSSTRWGENVCQRFTKSFNQRSRPSTQNKFASKQIYRIYVPLWGVTDSSNRSNK